MPVPTPVQNAGILPLGQSLRLGLSAVTSPGAVLAFSSTPAVAPALAPPGYQFLGPVFDLEAQDGLVVSGTVSIGIEYGSASLLGVPEDQLEDISIVRIANGEDFMLPSEFVSPDFIVADYSSDPTFFDSDPFGEFGLVEAVPEPPGFGTALLAGTVFLIALRGRFFCTPASMP